MAELAEFATIARERAAGWRRMAFLMCGDWSRAEDLVQQALIRMYAHWTRIEPGGIDAYARRVLTRLAIDEFRRPYRRAEVAGAVLPDLPVRQSDTAEVLDVRAALQRVPPRQRAALVLRYYQELSVQETAVALGVSEGTVKSQTARGLANLRAALNRDTAALQSSGRTR